MTELATPDLSQLRRGPGAPPCPRCGAHDSKLPPAGWKATCGSCGKAFSFGRADMRPLKMPWVLRARDGDGNEYAIQPDVWVRGLIPGWMLEVNVLGTGYWFAYGGAHQLQSGAIAEAEHFRQHWRDLLPRRSFQRKYAIHDDVIAFARSRMELDGMAAHFERARREDPES